MSHIICNDLFSRNLIEFKENPRHKRSKLAVLTEPGHRAFQHAQEKEHLVIEQLFQGIEIEKAAEARRMLTRLRKTMENLPEAALIPLETR